MTIRDATAEGVPSGGRPIAAPEHEHEKLTVLTDQLRKEFEIYGTSNCAANANSDRHVACTRGTSGKRITLLPMADKLISAVDQRGLRIWCI